MRSLGRNSLFIGLLMLLAVVPWRRAGAIPVGPAVGDMVFGATNSMHLQQGAEVHSGSVVVNLAATTPTLTTGFELQIGLSVTTPADYGVFAHRIRIRSGAVIGGDVGFNQLQNNGTIIGDQTTPCSLPVIADWPTAPPANPGDYDIEVAAGTTESLAPGAYGTLTVRQGATVIFSGGEYDFEAIDGGEQCNFLCLDRTRLRIAGKFDTDERSYFGPAPEAEVGADEIIVYVHGINGNTGTLGATPKAAQIGLNNTVLANFVVPNGTLWLRQNSEVTGSFVARDLDVGLNVQANLDSAHPVPPFIREGRLLYFRWTAAWGTDSDLRSVKPDGSDDRLETNHGQGGSYHPSGDWAVYNVPITGDFEVWRVNTDGSATGQVQLTSTPGQNFSPFISPDGQRMLYNSSRRNPSDSFDLYTRVIATGLETKVLERLSSTSGSGGRWAGDSRHVFYTDPPSGSVQHIWWIDVDAPNPQPEIFTSVPLATTSAPVVGRDGRLLLIGREGSTSAPMGLFRLNADGSGFTRLISGPDLRAAIQAVGGPYQEDRVNTCCWSPDQTRIAFSYGQHGNLEVYVAELADIAGTLAHVASGNVMDWCEAAE